MKRVYKLVSLENAVGESENKLKRILENDQGN